MSNLVSVQKLTPWDGQKVGFDMQFNEPYCLSQNLSRIDSFSSFASTENFTTSHMTSSVSDEQSFHQSDIVANAFSSATSVESPAFSFPEYDPLVDPFDSTSPAAESVPKKHCRLVTSPISPASVDQSNFYSSAYVTSAQQAYYSKVGNENFYLTLDYQQQDQPITTSDALRSNGELDLDSDDLLNFDNDPGFYELLTDDYYDDTETLQQSYSHSKCMFLK